MLGWLALAVAQPLVEWEALQRPDALPGMTAAFAPDGTGLLWQRTEGDQVEVHLQWLPDGKPLEPLVVDRPVQGRVLTRWSLPRDPRVLVIDGSERTRFTYRDGAWTELALDAPTRWPTFSAAPEARLQWERRGRNRYTVTRSVDGEIEASWQVRLGRGDVPLWDEGASLRAVGRRKRRGLHYRSTDKQPFVAPTFVPFPNPGRRRMDLRRRSMVFTLVENTLWTLDSRGREHTAVVTVDVTDGTSHTVFEDPDGDVFAVSLHPDRSVVDMALVLDALPRWEALDPALEADLAWVQATLPKPLVRIWRSRGDQRWHACGNSPHEGMGCAYFDRETRQVVPTFAMPATADPVPIPETQPIPYTTDDGLVLDSFLVLPHGTETNAEGRPTSPLPTVVLLHGGPFSRVNYEHVPLRAFLASRGYAVFDFNFRGSTFLGRSVLEAGTGERGRAIEKDVEAAATWLVQEGIADPGRMAVMGHSYGGYSTLLNLARRPDQWACGVALAPQAGWSYRWLVWALPRSLRRRAPYTQLDRIQDPVLLIHGRQDRVIPVNESRHVAKVLDRRGHPVTLIEVDDGHGLSGDGVEATTANALEAFLAGCLGGRQSPLNQEGWATSATVEVGAKWLEGGG